MSYWEELCQGVSRHKGEGYQTFVMNVEEFEKIRAVVVAAGDILNDPDGDLEAFSPGLIKALRQSLKDLGVIE